MGYGDHWIATPSQRWTVLVTYWMVLYVVLKQFGYMNYIYDIVAMTFFGKPFMVTITLTKLHILSLVIHMLFLSFWRYSVYAFHRQISIFSTVVYPIGHILDTLLWYAIFDFGSKVVYGSAIVQSSLNNLFKFYAQNYHKFYIYDSTTTTTTTTSTNSISEDNLHETYDTLISWCIGYMFMSIGIMLHRRTFEVWYLPEHHPPTYIRNNQKRYLLFIIIATGIQSYIYHTTSTNDSSGGGLYWCILVKYCMDLYCVLGIRLPSPFCEFNVKEHDRNCIYWKDWTGY